MSWDDDSQPEIGQPFWPDDDWEDYVYDPVVDGPPDPACWSCGDQRTVRGMFGTMRPCPWCERPTWVDSLYQEFITLRWRFGLWRHLRRFRSRRRRVLDDEPPF